MATSTATQRVQNTFKTETSDYIKHLEEGNEKAKTKRFQRLMGVVLTAALLGGGSYLILKEPSEWGEWVQTLATQSSQKDTIMTKVATQKMNLEGVYDQNKKALVNLSKFKEVATVLKKNPEQIQTFASQNEKLYKDIQGLLNKDDKSLSGLFVVAELNSAFNKDKKESVEKDLKTAKKNYLSKESMELFTVYRTTAPNRVAPLQQLNNSILTKGRELETAYNEISAQVNKGLADKLDFSLGEKAFLDSANEEVSAQMTQIENAKKTGDLEGSDYDELVKNSEEAKKEISSSISSDKQKVEELVKKYGASNVQTQQNANGGQTIVVHEKSGGMGFAEMWLLSQWMGSSSPASYNNGYSAGVAAANTNNTNNRDSRNYGGSGGGVYGALNKPSASTPAAALNTQKSYSSLYSLNNPSSKVSQKFAAMEATRNPGRPNFNTLSQKIAEKKNATIVRRAEAARVSARAAAARSNAAKPSTSSFGRTGGGFSSGGG